MTHPVHLSQRVSQEAEHLVFHLPFLQQVGFDLHQQWRQRGPVNGQGGRGMAPHPKPSHNAQGAGGVGGGRGGPVLHEALAAVAGVGLQQETVFHGGRVGLAVLGGRGQVGGTVAVVVVVVAVLLRGWVTMMGVLRCVKVQGSH